MGADMVRVFFAGDPHGIERPLLTGHKRCALHGDDPHGRVVASRELDDGTVEWALVPCSLCYLADGVKAPPLDVAIANARAAGEIPQRDMLAELGVNA